jgi:hypothetical protein
MQVLACLLISREIDVMSASNATDLAACGLESSKKET